MPRGYVDYSAPYFAEKEKSLQRQNQQAAYAAGIAEQLGYYTPELQQQVLAPLGKTPTVGENILGAPVRGLGKLLGVESLQGVGAPQPFDLGQARQQPQYPSIPAGVSPEQRQAMEQIAQSMGFAPPKKEPTIPAEPSEISGKPRLKTAAERKAEQRYQDRVWDFILKTYQTDQQRQAAEAEIAQTLQAIEESKAREAEIRKRTQRGIPPNEWQLIKDYMEETGQDYVTVMRQLNSLKSNKTAALQIYDAAVAAGHFGGTFEEWSRLMNRAKWNPIDAAASQFYSNPFQVFQIPVEQHPAYIAQVAKTLAQAAEKVNEDLLTKGGENIPIPQELMALGITEESLSSFQNESGLSRANAIKELMDYARRRAEIQKPVANTPAKGKENAAAK